MSCCRRCNDAALFTQLHELSHPLQLGGKNAFAERCEAIVATAFVVIALGGTAPGFLEQPVTFEMANRSIEVAGFERDQTVGMLEDVLTDAIAVALSGGHASSTMRVDRFERKQRFWERPRRHSGTPLRTNDL